MEFSKKKCEVDPYFCCPSFRCTRVGSCYTCVVSCCLVLCRVVLVLCRVGSCCYLCCLVFCRVASCWLVLLLVQFSRLDLLGTLFNV